MSEDKKQGYDCTDDVLAHIQRVEYYLGVMWQRLVLRAKRHDRSKLDNPVEKAMFDKWTPELKEREFGTDAYKVALDGMGEGIALHYKANRHHPEHFPNGVNDMTIIDVVEMLCDWMAAAQARGVPVDLDHAAERFGLSEQLVKIFANTLREEDYDGNIVDGSLLCPENRRNGYIEES